MSVETAVDGAVLDKQVEPVLNGLAVWDGMPAKWLCNFDGDEREQFALRMRCMAARNEGDAVGAVIEIKYWFIHEVEFIDADSKETVRTFRTVLIDPAGKMVAAVSQGVAKGVKLLHGQFGCNAIEPPFKAQISRTKTGNGRQFYQLVPA